MAKTAAEIAERINVHLKTAEADREWNEYDHRGMILSKLYHAHASAGKSKTAKYVHVVYVSYQGRTRLSKADAESFLAWLDEGNRGTHYQQQRDKGAADASA